MSQERLRENIEKPFLNNLSEAVEYSKKYNIPVEDVLLIGLNLSGIRYKNIHNDRGRFKLSLPGDSSYILALTITDSPNTKFIHNGEEVVLDNQIIGKATSIEKDTCTDSYWRNRTHLTLNSNSRSICKGCKFCGTYSLERQDLSLTEEDKLFKRANELAKEVGDFSSVDAIGVVTGCFNSEEDVTNHIKLVRNTFSKVGFNGEIQYVGSQLRSERSISELIKDGPFSLYLTVEAFSKRELLMSEQKSSLQLDEAINILETTKKSGGESSFLYIAGLDSLPVIYQNLPRFSDVVTRFPQLQTYQLYNPEQAQYRDSEARNLDYYLKLRNFSEKNFEGLKPITFHNYRGLWYSEFRGESI